MAVLQSMRTGHRALAIIAIRRRAISLMRTHTGHTLDTHWTHTGPRCLDHPEPGLDRPFLEARRLKAIQTDLKIQRAACLVETPDAGNRYKNKKVKSFECPSLAKLDCPDEATKSFAIQ